jgi:hypothetical protein
MLQPSAITVILAWGDDPDGKVSAPPRGDRSRDREIGAARIAEHTLTVHNGECR